MSNRIGGIVGRQVMSNQQSSLHCGEYQETEINYEKIRGVARNYFWKFDDATKSKIISFLLKRTPISEDGVIRLTLGGPTLKDYFEKYEFIPNKNKGYAIRLDSDQGFIMVDSTGLETEAVRCDELRLTSERIKNPRYEELNEKYNRKLSPKEKWKVLQQLSETESFIFDHIISLQRNVVEINGNINEDINIVSAGENPLDLKDVLTADCDSSYSITLEHDIMEPNVVMPSLQSYITGMGTNLSVDSQSQNEEKTYKELFVKHYENIQRMKNLYFITNQKYSNNKDVKGK